MASYLRPRRGQKSTAESQAIVLKKGEVFFEIGNSGTPTTGSSAIAFGKIKMGDGSTTYSNLGYFIDVDTTAVAWDNTGYTSATSASQGADLYGNLNAITPSATVKSIFGNIKALLYKLSTQVTQLNNDLTDKIGFVDTSNLLYSSTNSTSGSHNYSWTATADAYVYVKGTRVSGQPFSSILIDGVEVASIQTYAYSTATLGQAFCSVNAYVKAGQVVNGQYTSDGTRVTGMYAYALM